MQIFIFVGSDNFSGYFCAYSEADIFPGLWVARSHLIARDFMISDESHQNIPSKHKKRTWSQCLKISEALLQVRFLNFHGQNMPGNFFNFRRSF